MDNKKMLTKKQKILISIGGCVLLLLIIGGIFFLLNKDDESSNLVNNTSGVVDNKVLETSNDDLKAPAENTEELLKTLDKVEVTALDKNTITFTKDVEVKTGEKVAVWVYSTPKFLGYFEVVIEKGIAKITGLEEALKKLEVENGNHNLVVVNETGKALGYIDVYIDDNSLYQDEESKDTLKEENTEKDTQEISKEETNKTTTKEEVVEEKIAYKVITQNEVNMKKGTKEIIRKGEEGIKKITYKVVCDASGKVVSKEKVSEKVTKEATDQIEKVGTSDFNINTDKITEYTAGIYCTEDKTHISSYDGLKYCDDETYTDLKQFSATKINDTYYVTKVDETKVTPFVITFVNEYVNKGTYNGTLYYFDGRMGSVESVNLTMEICEEYKFSCGAW